mmetsp:Transcript_10944/g.18299  ORF Transcript_10944/g.18299 Transcript_10944/m.18299 type:complete len:122 (+) Transcript_10944:153-518(+)
MEEEKGEEDKPKHRQIDRIRMFDIQNDDENPKNKVIDKGTNCEVVVKNTLGKGAFCKVKECDAKVIRDLKRRGTEEEVEVKGIQQLAMKVFNKKGLKQRKTSEYDPFSGVLRISDQLNSIY